MSHEGTDNSDSGHQGARLNGQSKARALQPDESAANEIRELDQGSEEGRPGTSIEAREEHSMLSVTQHADFKQCQELLLALQHRIAELSGHGDDNSIAGKYTGSGSKTGRDTLLDSAARSTAQLQITPSICKRDWFHFMNKVASEQVEYAIEVLVGEPDYHPRRATTRSGKRRSKVPDSVPRTKVGEGEGTSETSLSRNMPNRIRINSLPILKHLKELDNSIDATTPLIILRPFKQLIHHETAIRETIVQLRQQTYELQNLTLGAVVQEPDADVSGASTPDVDKSGGLEALKHMEILEQFIDEYIRPTLARLANNVNVKVRFSELWLLFKPGDDIHMPLKIQDTSINADGFGITPETFQSRYNKLWRVTSISGGRPNIQDAHS